MAADVEKRIEKFWAWFAKRSSKLRGKAGDAIADVVHGKLQRIDRDLGVLVGDWSDETEVIFTAHAVLELVALVRSVVASAPTLPGWQFIAFVPPAGEPFVHERPGGVRVDSEVVLFEPLESAGHRNAIGLRLYVPPSALTHEESEDILWSIVATAAGEELTCYVEQLEGTELVTKMDGDCAPLSELAGYLESRIERLKN